MAVFDKVREIVDLVCTAWNLTLQQPMSFTCVETQIGDGSQADCEIVELDGANGVYKLVIPTL
jgi:hypothetical protein